jgi:phosphate transport system permease protein
MIREFLSKPSSRYSIQRLGFGMLTLIAVITVVPIIAIIVHIFMQGISAISWEFLTSFPRDGMQAGGIFPAIVGTFFLTLGTAIISIPISIGAAIYLAEYAPDNRWTRAIRIAIINLAGIPSVVYGLFGLGLFVIFLNIGTSIFAGCLTLSIMTLPVFISTSEGALKSVPHSFRVVSISLGATLGLERAVGETAPILFTAAAFFLPQLPNTPFDPTMALPYHLFVISTQVPGMPIELQYGTALVLLTFIIGMNILATIIRSRARARRQW